MGGVGRFDAVCARALRQRSAAPHFNVRHRHTAAAGSAVTPVMPPSASHLAIQPSSHPSHLAIQPRHVRALARRVIPSRWVLREWEMRWRETAEATLNAHRAETRCGGGWRWLLDLPRTWLVMMLHRRPRGCDLSDRKESHFAAQPQLDARDRECARRQHGTCPPRCKPQRRRRHFLPEQSPSCHAHGMREVDDGVCECRMSAVRGGSHSRQVRGEAMG